MENLTWFITGISSGIGAALAQAALAAGHRVAGTTRSAATAAHFSAAKPGHSLGLVADLTDPDAPARAVQAAQQALGPIDVLVNNAGFGFTGAVEETSPAEAQGLLAVNTWAPLAFIKAVLPDMRAHKSGHIIQISSHAGVKGFAGFGLYAASKFALEGYTEALHTEVKPLSIKVTLVEPGPFRTAFAGASLQRAAAQIADYQTTALAFRERLEKADGRQEGDPAKAAAAILALAAQAEPPLRLPLGPTALATLEAKAHALLQDVENARAVAQAAVFA